MLFALSEHANGIVDVILVILSTMCAKVIGGLMLSAYLQEM